MVKKNKRDIEFELKERAINMAKKKYPNLDIIEEGRGYFIIAYPQKLDIMVKYNSTFQEQERRESKDMCIVRSIGFMDIEIPKGLKTWVDRGCQHDFITVDGYYEENVSLK